MRITLALSLLVLVLSSQCWAMRTGPEDAPTSEVTPESKNSPAPQKSLPWTSYSVESLEEQELLTVLDSLRWESSPYEVEGEVCEGNTCYLPAPLSTLIAKHTIPRPPGVPARFEIAEVLRSPYLPFDEKNPFPSFIFKVRDTATYKALWPEFYMMHFKGDWVLFGQTKDVRGRPLQEDFTFAEKACQRKRGKVPTLEFLKYFAESSGATLVNQFGYFEGQYQLTTISNTGNYVPPEGVLDQGFIWSSAALPRLGHRYYVFNGTRGTFGHAPWIYRKGFIWCQLTPLW